LVLGAPASATLVPPFTGGGALPPAPGTPSPVNHDAEPAVAVTPDGTLWATSIVVGTDPRGGGQDIWRSTDHGVTWQWMAAPFNATPHDPVIGGDDGDLVVAGARNGAGNYNVYAASLWVATGAGGLLLGDISLALSRDNGASWIVHPLAAEYPGDDRPWLAADGACRVYLVYHSGPTVANVVNTYDLCDPAATVQGLTLAPIASTRCPDLAGPFLQQQPAMYVTVGFGKPAVDALSHNLYIPMVDCPALTPQQEVARGQNREPNCPNGQQAAVFVAVGTDNATNWTLHPVAVSQYDAVPIWPTTIAVDGTGKLYLAWHDNHHAFLQTSSDAGLNWSKPQQVDPANGTAVYPTVGAAGSGLVQVAWYGTDAVGDANDPTAMSGATWRFYRATSAGAPPGQVVGAPQVVDDHIHDGVLCTRGTSCAVPDTRSLLDDFGIAVLSQGQAAVVYTNDQPGGGFANDVTRWAVLP
ncbi:MAG TPA: sialidase family protein, partial [Acidimicrobiales bacterium]|nr:sialidase family protein [Acidimicrobiales bacterium]